MDYQLKIIIPFSETDDVDARRKAKDVISKLNLSEDSVVKMQRLQKNKEPIGVEI